jgi:16S rRNA pseudouridine516 synthase
MPAYKTRLDRFLANALHINRKAVKPLLAAKRVRIDHDIAVDCDAIITRFSHICVDDQVLQARQARYVMLHKPAGILSATKDTSQKTVMSLLPPKLSEDLHIVGRLDKNSTGLLLLSNDGEWSNALISPKHHVEKTYLVRVKNDINQDCVEAFARGIHFPFEDVVTLPSRLEILEPTLAKVTLTEGRYHQIKRMFGRFRNPVLQLHRLSIGKVRLDPALNAGQHRTLKAEEI